MQEIKNTYKVYDINIHNIDKRIRAYNQVLTNIISNIENETDFWSSIYYWDKIRNNISNKFSEKINDLKKIDLDFLSAMQNKFREIEKDKLLK